MVGSKSVRGFWTRGSAGCCRCLKFTIYMATQFSQDCSQSPKMNFVDLLKLWGSSWIWFLSTSCAEVWEVTSPHCLTGREWAPLWWRIPKYCCCLQKILDVFLFIFNTIRLASLHALRETRSIQFGSTRISWTTFSCSPGITNGVLKLRVHCTTHP